MDLYKELVGLRCFARADMVRIVGSDSAAQWQIKNYLDKGYIERVRRDLYAVISMETEQPIPSRFQIASRIADNACVSHHSAFEYYGYANQVYYDVYFSTEKKVRPFDYDGLHYQPVIWRGSSGIACMNNGVRVTSLERTVIDSIADFTRIGGLEELLRCMALIPSLNENGLREALEMYNRGQLYQKAGYILEAYKDDLSLSDQFFDDCARKISASKTYLFPKEEDFAFHKKWLLYAPKNLKRLIDKGVNDYDAA
ncbi:Transcriptional regulator, predicted component of viral defense system [Lachnospiraceae bacterium NK3A20]|jgi:predicted transcriptional regulator of viral defense system|nr:Transcriptional regulator, predicted component of viral defense system [Lachnospiraceae bacterium NK3A20]